MVESVWPREAIPSVTARLEILGLAALAEVLDGGERVVGLDAGRLAVEHQAHCAGRRDRGSSARCGIRAGAQLERRAHSRPAADSTSVGSRPPSRQRLDVALDHREHGLAVSLELGERPQSRRQLGGAAIGDPGHQRSDRGSPIASSLGVVRDSEREQQRGEVREPIPIGAAAVRCPRSARSGSRSRLRSRPAPPRGAPPRR